LTFNLKIKYYYILEPMKYFIQPFLDFYNIYNDYYKLKKENEILKYKLDGVTLAKNEIYEKYQNLIIKKNVNRL
tara:strand:- start:44 stop:265 length:222 start_codon:yes stop_codon:yes gene_type:complete